jgi:hypothetical protein
MQASQTTGLALYQQVMNQTPGIASAIWVQGTSLQQSVLVQVVPIQLEKKDKESLKEKTASGLTFGAIA